MFTKKQVGQMKEDELRDSVLIPLLRVMGYRDVYKYHGGDNEKGKDIVCWELGKLNNRANLALVVKAKPLSGRINVDKGTAGEVRGQVQQCFARPFVDPITGDDQDVHECWVVSNKKIEKNAVDALKSALGLSVYKGNVLFVGIDTLWELVEKHLRFQATLQKLEEVQQDYNTLDSHYRLDALISGNVIRHTLAEKFPGASLEKPLEIKSVFSIPVDTPDGRELQDAVERFFRTGSPVKIPSAYIKSLEYSDFLQHVYPAVMKDGYLELGSIPNSQPLLLRCEIFCNDGDRFELPYIHLTCIRAGTKEAMLTNQGQPIQVEIEMVLRSDSTVGSFHLSLVQGWSLNVHELLMQMRLLRCLSKPHTVRFTNLSAGFPCGSSRSDIGACDVPDRVAMASLEALEALQIKSGRLVFFPDRELTAEEYQNVDMLRVLFRTGKLTLHCEESSCSITVTDDNREEVFQVLRPFEGSSIGTFISWQEEQLNIFGGEYPLGPVKYTFQAKLANEVEVKAFLDQGLCGDLRLKFVSGGDKRLIKEYENWLPLADESFD